MGRLSSEFKILTIINWKKDHANTPGCMSLACFLCQCILPSQELIKIANQHNDLSTHEGLCNAVAQLVGGPRCVSWPLSLSSTFMI